MLVKLTAENPYKEMSGVITLMQTTPEQTEWTIGRLPECDLTLDEADVSREHARIKYADDGFCFVDHSSNGSTVNGVPIATNIKYPLKKGDRLGIGNTILTVEDLHHASAQGVDGTQNVQYWTDQELTLRCFRVVTETPDTKTFSFVGEPPVLFHYLPGQFVNLEFDVDGKKVVRPYSISSSPSSPYALSVTVKRVPDGVISNWMNDHLKVGDAVRVLPGGAKGKFSCLPHVPSKLLLMGAGSGITPLMSMLRWIYDTGTEQITDVVLIYSVKSARDIIFRQELEMMASRMVRCRVIFTLTSPQPGETWSGFVGRVSDSLLKLVVPDFMERSVFVCGSTEFMKSMKSMLQGLQFPIDTQYQQESFGGKPAAKAVKSAPATHQENGNGNGKGHSNGHAPDTHIVVDTTTTQPTPEHTGNSNGSSTTHVSVSVEAPANTETTTKPQEEKVASVSTANPMVVFGDGNQIESDESSTILELAELAGVSLHSGCGAGVCGTCKVKVLKGQARHEPEEPSDVTLSPADRAAGYVLSCIAHPVGHVELEIKDS